MARYRMIKPFPAVLEFRGGVRLVYRRCDRTYGGEGIYYHKEPLQARGSLTVVECEGNQKLDDLLSAGFVPKEGEKGERFMETLVRLGYAEPV